MKYMGLNEIREEFLSFFESKGHLRLPSFSLIPKNDNSLLLINSGMAPMKPFFTGDQTPPRTRVTTCQKCIRTGDIENVGKTARHGTYFEMLGNFSFGDYFKNEAITWSWEFLTEVMGIDPDRLYPSIYLDDDEAFEIWHSKVGIPADRIFRFGKEDNFWEHGSGPCGPCSEIYYDRGEEYGCHKPDCTVGCDCDRYMEVWNNVFSQFNNDGNGNYTELKQKNIDTGMGLERLACVIQNVGNLFEVDTVKNIMLHVSNIAGIQYHENEMKDVSLRVITDHIRSTVMMVADGIIPSNEGRGYVLRRLLRRAARHGKLLGIDKAFLFDVCETVIKENESAYPELRDKESYIKKVIQIEEERFISTLDSGLKKYYEMTELLKTNNTTELSGADAFKLYDTYGFPIDLTEELLQEKGFTLDRDQFNHLMNEQKERARSAREKLGDLAWANKEESFDTIKPTIFHGYGSLECKGRVLALIKDGELSDSANEGEFKVILDETPFYAESGGQIADTGVIKLDNATLEVLDVQKDSGGRFIHSVRIEEGSVEVGQECLSTVDFSRRQAIRRAHTATHLLQKALRNTLGEHIEQAGSLVQPDLLRFDFTHFSALTPEEIYQVENEINDMILNSLPVNVFETSLDEAKNMGAMALFGDKYGDIVRVVKIGDYSIELCGGTHLDNSSAVGSIKIISESSVAAGVRRIEAFVGKNVQNHLHELTQNISLLATILKTNPQDLKRRVEQVLDESREQRKEIDRLNSKLNTLSSKDLLASARSAGNCLLITQKYDGMPIDSLRNMADQIRDQDERLIVVLATTLDGKIGFASACGKAAISAGAHAGNILKEVARICGGGGGGRPDSATAGGKDLSQLDNALQQVDVIVAKLIKS